MSAFPGFEHLYSFAALAKRGGFVAEVSLSRDSELRTFLGAVSPRLMAARWSQGKRNAPNIVQTASLFSAILSSKVVLALEQEGVTGWSAIPCELTGRDGSALGEYFFLQVTGRCGPLEDKRSSRERRLYDGKEYIVLAGTYFDPDSYSGHDIVTPEVPPYTFVTERVKAILEMNNVADGVFFKRLDQTERAVKSFSE